ncbi:MAG TPA: MarC family protein [Candidatus Acidoferrales bacterium]|nr:MarC family protein [Candidatus Acidoferrales bacterium]
MANAVKVFFLVFSALFPIVDPLTGSPIFLALTGGDPPEMRRVLSWWVSLNSLILMLGSYFIGADVLSFFGVSLPVVQVGGGLVVISMGWGMLMAKEDVHDVTRTNVPPQDVIARSFYPLTLPLTVGPGSISVAVALGANSTHRYGFHFPVILAAIIAMTVIALTILLCYGFAERLARMLGKTAMTVIVRLSSFLLVCIGVQIMWNGVSALLSSVPFHAR